MAGLGVVVLLLGPVPVLGWLAVVAGIVTLNVSVHASAHEPRRLAPRAGGIPLLLPVLLIGIGVYCGLSS
jgi:hypothetical protein